MGRGIVHRKVQTNRVREMGAPDHQQAGHGAFGFSSIHRDDPERVQAMLTPRAQVAPADDVVTLRRSELLGLLARVEALEAAGKAAPPAVRVSDPPADPTSSAGT